LGVRELTVLVRAHPNLAPVAVFNHEELDVFLFIVGGVIRVCYATAKRWTKSEAAVG
jgi:hypothetical protein